MASTTPDVSNRRADLAGRVGGRAAREEVGAVRACGSRRDRRGRRAGASGDGRNPRTVEELQGRVRQVSAWGRQVRRARQDDRCARSELQAQQSAFATAMHYNRGLDRDHDKIACEKH
jgi:hypothetical protein